jgi:hypothetical protein
MIWYLASSYPYFCKLKQVVLEFQKVDAGLEEDYQLYMLQFPWSGTRVQVWPPENAS